MDASGPRGPRVSGRRGTPVPTGAGSAEGIQILASNPAFFINYLVNQSLFHGSDLWKVYT